MLLFDEKQRIIRKESVMFAGGDTAALAFPGEKILQGSDSTGNRVYQEGIDFRYDPAANQLWVCPVLRFRC